MVEGKERTSGGEAEENVPHELDDVAGMYTLLF